MTTSAAVEKVAGQVVEKDKVEKRRALGRGLESLLPGPRVVSPPFAESAKDGAAGVVVPVRDSSGGSGQQIPHGLSPVRNDKSLDGDDAARDVPAAAENAELRSGQPLRPGSGQAGAAVSTFD